MSGRERDPNFLDGAEADEHPLAEYLKLIERDMAAHPERIRPLSADVLARARALVDHIKTDLNEDLEDLDL